MQNKILNNRYKIIQEVGRGGMAIVYSAEDTLLGRRVAIKMLRPEYNSDDEFIKKFRHEARSVAKLTDPNVVSIYDIVVDEQKIYLVMEIIDGQTLKDLIKKRKTLSIAESLEIARQIASALSAAHKNKIIHCDIKPHNIILTDNKDVKVTDFGIARAVSQSTMKMTETIVGSAHYFSPEQAKGGEIKAYSDIYALGVVLYEMTTGELPFQGESPISVALKHIQQEPTPPSQINTSIPEAVNNLILKAMAKDPADRFQNVDQLKNEIIYCLKNLNIKESQNKKENDFTSEETKIMKKADFNFDKEEKQESDSTSKKELSEKQNKKNEEITAVINGDLLKKKKQTVANSESKSTYQSLKEKFNNSKYKKLLTISAAVILFLLITIGGIVLFFNQYTNVPIVEVPMIEEHSLSEAQKIISEVGLNLAKNKERVFSEEIKKDHIISQQPEAGERIKQSRAINITVSKGAQLIEVPNLNSKSLREALLELDNLSLNSGDIQYIFRLSEEPGTVINQIPAPGAEVEKGSEITLFVSRGERDISVQMPDLTGLTQDQAMALIKDKSLSVGQVKVEDSTRFTAGQVISQSIKAGELLPKEIAVDFVISRGSSNLSSENKHLNRISVNLNGNQSKEVRIVVEDDNGEDQVYQAVHNPGDNIIRDIQSQGETEVRIYFDEQLIRKENFGG